MQPSASFVTNWYLHVPDLIVVALFYLLVVRIALATLVGWQSSNLAARVLAAVTNPVLAATGAITPRAVPKGGVALFALVWLFALRFVLVYAMTLLRVRPLLG
jgi:uncharacterized protein YggT (Ycf19 family)